MFVSIGLISYLFIHVNCLVTMMQDLVCISRVLVLFYSLTDSDDSYLVAILLFNIARMFVKLNSFFLHD